MAFCWLALIPLRRRDGPGSGVPILERSSSSASVTLVIKDFSLNCMPLVGELGKPRSGVPAAEEGEAAIVSEEGRGGGGMGAFVWR